MYHFTGLEGERVRLIPLERSHAIPLFNCSRDPEIWSSYPVKIKSLEDMNKFIDKALDGLERKEQFPFAVFDKLHNEIVGSTRFLRISEEHNNMNIGSTWYSSKVWRTSVNTETKYMMLKYAFETLNTDRVEIVTSTDNVRSQKAIERLGAVKEGILRKKYYNLDYVIYSIIQSEWSDIRNKLEGYLSRD
ncbi:GNAT family N-acetyltransferase [Cohnella mopanensis]|uniref:GNAT family N-acetyltransferase n=1 Tax=Cohnella mopanensis TaxID=2911966 RepID=UPI001EF996B6|nr:GNAT family N-acetyltransferase [Cohnella mopanensis]